MLNSLSIENYKCFRSLRLPLGALTLLTGFNGAGKSSAIQPILLLSQAIKLRNIERIALNGEFASLGTVADVMPVNSESANLVFRIGADDETLTWVLSASASERSLKVVERNVSIEGLSGSGDRLLGQADGLDKLLSRLSYVSAVRGSIQDAYPIPKSSDDRIADVGCDGRFAAFWYDANVDEEVPLERRHPKEEGITLRKQVDAWLGTLFPGAEVNAQNLAQAALVALQFRVSVVGPWRRPANVGYGLSYSFPILVALLVAPVGQVVVVDSPEAHLHPFAQSQMGRLLVRFANAGVQILIETHSDHLLNGIRLAVKEAPEVINGVKVHFFTGATATEHGVISPSISRTGQLSEWPTGFFDQSEKDLSRLGGWD